MPPEFPKKVDETHILGFGDEFGRFGPVFLGAFPAGARRPATGERRNAALVAGTGLLRSTPRAQVEQVLGHEISHIASGDMVTLALLQGVLNTFVILLARIIGNVAALQSAT